MLSYTGTIGKMNLGENGSKNGNTMTTKEGKTIVWGNIEIFNQSTFAVDKIKLDFENNYDFSNIEVGAKVQVPVIRKFNDTKKIMEYKQVGDIKIGK